MALGFSIVQPLALTDDMFVDGVFGLMAISREDSDGHRDLSVYSSSGQVQDPVGVILFADPDPAPDDVVQALEFWVAETCLSKGWNFYIQNENFDFQVGQGGLLGAAIGLIVNPELIHPEAKEAPAPLDPHDFSAIFLDAIEMFDDQQLAAVLLLLLPDDDLLNEVLDTDVPEEEFQESKERIMRRLGITES